MYPKSTAVELKNGLELNLLNLVDTLRVEDNNNNNNNLTSYMKDRKNEQTEKNM